MALDSLVDSVTTYRMKPIWYHLYILPFFFIYAGVFYVWTCVYDFEEHYELGCIAVAIVAVLQVHFLCLDFLRKSTRHRLSACFSVTGSSEFKLS